jgi:hypothetical protein
MTLHRRIALAAVAALAAGCLTAAVEAAGEQRSGERVGDTQQCVPLQFIDQTPVIDNKTILVKMKAKGGYKRIDLLNSCSGLKLSGGFAHSTSTNDLCTTDPLRVVEPTGPIGATCMIDKIVTIDEAEAKALMAKR